LPAAARRADEEVRMLTETEKRVLSEAWGLALRGRRFVPEDAYAELCDDLHVRGWLSEVVRDLVEL
jgi:hypothetical protein